MGKAGRFACIFAPMVLSFAALICLLVVFLAGRFPNDGNLRSLYYFTADTSQFKANATQITGLLKGVDPNTKKLIEGLVAQATASKSNLKDVYYVYIWNSCNAAKTGYNGTVDLKSLSCTSPTAQYYFNPLVEWGLNGTTYQQYIPKAINSAMNAYQKGAQWMFIAYAVAFFSTIATIVVGVFAICSRVGSCVTTIVSGVATLFTVLAAVTSTILFSTLVGALGTTLRPYQIKLSVGTKMMALEWTAVAFSVAASMFWLVSICCCSGKSSHKDRKSSAPAVGGAFGTKGYQPLGDQHLQGPNPYHSAYGAPQGHRGMEMQEFGQTGGAGPYKGRETAYEPFRHQ